MKRLLGAILIARLRIIAGLGDMGAKYIPTIKDLKANQINPWCISFCWNNDKLISRK